MPKIELELEGAGGNVVVELIGVGEKVDEDWSGVADEGNGMADEDWSGMDVDMPLQGIGGGYVVLDGGGGPGKPVGCVAMGGGALAMGMSWVLRSLLVQGPIR